MHLAALLFFTLLHPLAFPVALLALVIVSAVSAHVKAFLLWLAAAASFALFGTTVAYPGFGSHLQSGGTAGTSFTNVAQLKNVKFSGLKADFDDITNLDSPTGGAGLAVFKEYLKTMVDGDTVTFDGVHNPADPTTQALLANLQTAGQSALFFWQIVLTNGSTLKFQGYVSDYKENVEYNKAITFSGAIKIVGPITATW
jgi:tail tube protein